MADYTIKILTDSAKAEQSLDRVDKKKEKLAEPVTVRVNPVNTNLLNQSLDVAKASLTAAFTVSQFLPGFMDVNDLLRRTARGATTVATAMASIPKDPGGIIAGSFKTAGDAALSLSSNIAGIGFAIFGVTQSVNLMKAAYSGFFEETVGREIRLQEVLLQTKTAIAANSKVLVNDKEITDPYKAIIALGKPIEKTIENIRIRSLEIAGTTSDAIIQTFGVVSQQIGQFNGTLKDAEDLSISFAGALGTLGMSDPTLAVQEVRSILTGNIGPDSLLARTLGITGPEIAKAKTSTEGLVAWLTKKLAAFTAGQAIASKSFFGITSNLAEIRQELLRALGKPVLDPILTGLSMMYDRLSAVVKPAQALANTLGETAAAVAGGIGNAVVASPLVQRTEGSGAQDLFGLAQAQAERFMTYVKGQISEMQPVITKFVTQFGYAFVQFGQGLAKLIEGYAQFKFEGFKVFLNSISNLAGALNVAVLPALNKILQLYGQLLQLPPIQYLSQYLTQWKALEQLQVLPMARGLFTLAKSWGTINMGIKLVRGAIDGVGTAFETMRKLAVDALTGIANAIRGALVGLVNLGIAGATFGAKLAAGIVGGLGMVVAKAAVIVGELSVTVITGVETMLAKVLQSISTFIQKLVITIGSGMAGIAPMIQSALGGLAGKLGGVAGMEPFVEGLNRMKDGLDDVPGKAKKMADGIQNATQGGIVGLGELGKKAKTGAAGMEELGKKGQRGIQGLKAPIMGAIGNIQGFGATATRALAQFDFGLGAVKAGLTRLGAGIQAVAAQAAAAIGGLVKSVAIFYAQMLLLQVGITLVMDLMGRFQKAQEDTRSAAKAAEALKQLETTYKNVGEASDKAAIKAKEAAQQIVDARYDQVTEEIALLSKRLNEMKWEDSVDGVDSLGEAFRSFWGLTRMATDSFNKFVESTKGLKGYNPFEGMIKSIDRLIKRIFGINDAIASIKPPKDFWMDFIPFGGLLKGPKAMGDSYASKAAQNDLDKAKQEQARLAQKAKAEADAEDFKLQSNRALDLSKQLKDLAMSRENELHQMRMRNMGREIDVYAASQNLLLVQANMRANAVMKGEQGAALTMMQNIRNYLNVKKEGENSIEIARRRMTIEVLNMEREMVNFRYNAQKQIAELQKAMGAYETGVADYKYKMAVKQMEALQAGTDPGNLGMTGDTGLRMGSTGLSTGPHYHVEGAKTEAEARAIFADKNLQMTSAMGDRRHPITGQIKHHAGWDLSGGHGRMELAPGYKLTKFEKDKGDGYGNVAYVMNELTKAVYKIAHIANAPAGWTMAAQGAGTGKGAPQTGIQGYAARLAYLESSMKWDVNKSSGTKGFFQFKDGTSKEAQDKFGVSQAQLLSKNYGTASTAFARYVQARFPQAYAAIQAGDFATADKMLKDVWVSLPGGSQHNAGKMAAANKLAGRTMTVGASTPSTTSTGMPTAPKMPDLKAMNAEYIASAEALNKAFMETSKRIDDITAQITNLKTKEAFDNITNNLFPTTDLVAMQGALDDAVAKTAQLAEASGKAYDPVGFAQAVQYSQQLAAAKRLELEGYRGIEKLKKEGVGLSAEDEVKARKKIKDAYDKHLVDLAAALKLQKATTAELQKQAMMEELRASSRDLLEAADKEKRDIAIRMQNMLLTKEQREDPMTARMASASLAIDDKLREQRKKYPGMSDAAIRELPDFKTFVENANKSAKELGELERSALKLQKKLDEIEVIKGSVSGGIRNILMAAFKGGDIAGAISAAAADIGDKFLGMATDMLMKPIEQMLDSNLRNLMGVVVKSPQEANTAALDVAKSATEMNTEAVRELTAAFNNIRSTAFGTKKEGDFDVSSGLGVKSPDYSSFFSSESIKGASSMFDTSVKSFSSGIVAAATGTNYFTDALNNTPEAAGKASNSLASFFTNALNSILNSFGGGKGGGGGILGGLVNSLFGGGGGGGGSLFSSSGGGGLATNTITDLFSGVLGFAGGGNPPIGKGVMTGENGPELSLARGLNTIIPSGTTRALVDTLTNPIDRSAGVDAGAFNAQISYDGPVLNFNSEEYVQKNDIPRIVNTAVKQSHSYTTSRARNSPAYRRSVGL